MPFEPLVRRIVEEATVENDRILKIDHFLNHRIEPAFMADMGEALAERIRPYRPDLLLTAEASGIAPALAAAYALDLPRSTRRNIRRWWSPPPCRGWCPRPPRAATPARGLRPLPAARLSRGPDR